MIFLVHNQAKTLVFCKKKEQELSLKAETISDAFWELAALYPEELIIWIEKGQQSNFNKDLVAKIFHNDLIMASFAAETRFLDDRIGYVDELPFVHVNRDVKYPSWLMSADVGGIKGKVLLKFRSHFQHIKNFEYLLNAVAKIGQQNGLFSYSDPSLVQSVNSTIKYTATTRQLFQFVSQFYKKPRLAVLGWCFKKYEEEKFVSSFLTNYMQPSFFNQTIKLSDIEIHSNNCNSPEKSIDVIIPTIGRPEHLLNVLKDLRRQTLLPTKVIIVEQKPELDAVSDFNFNPKDWPFEIIHMFTHQTGACKARNRALSQVSSKWIFLADDDILIEDRLLEKAIEESNRLNTAVLNFNCLQVGEKSVYNSIKQWGSFGSGTSFLKTSEIDNLKFDEHFEYGYGEDMDYGIQLRNKGVDIIFHPNILLTHLKAPLGGFRMKIKKAWENNELQPKPSPTMMSYIKKNYTIFQIRGYKTVLWLKFYSAQSIKNPIRYRKEMQKRWEASEAWADQLLKENS